MALLAASLGLVVLSRGRFLVLSVVLLGVGSGAIAAGQKAAGCAAVWHTGFHTAVVRIDDRPSRRGLTTGTILQSAEGCGESIPLRFDSAAIVAGGSRVLASGVFRAPQVFHVQQVRVLAERRAWRFVVRDAIGHRIETLYGPRAPLVEALVTGRREDLERSLQDDFAASGLAHLLSISGLHVGIMAAWLVMILKRFLPRRIVLILSTAVSWGYVILLGCPAPATRTAAFITVHAVSRWRQRHSPPRVVLAVAILLVLVVDPSAVSSVGAWLSATAVWGTGAATELLPAAHRRSALKQLVAASVGATVVTAPITAFIFGAVAPIGIVANLIAVPVAGLAVPAVFLSIFAGGWMAAGAGLALAATERTAATAAAIPGGHVTGEPGVWFAAPWVLLLAVLWWARHRRPGWMVARRRLLWSGVAAASLMGLVAAVPLSRHAALEIYVLDVGQGDAIAIRSPHGRWILIDAGPRTPQRDAGRAVVLPFFRREGVRRLDVLVATHADADHLGGVPAVIRSMDPGLMLESGQAVGTALFLEHLAAIDANGLNWRAARAGDTLVVDSLVLAVLHPSAEWIAARSETNENSVVLRLTYGAFDAVLTGDMGFPVESTLATRVGPAEVLKVGHHGSAGATSDQWLAALRPAVAVISVGTNHYGHPSPATLDRLARAGVTVRRTDRGGTVTIGSDGRTFWVEQSSSVTFAERIRCLPPSWLRSSGSSWSRRDCTPGPAQRVSYPTFSTTSRSPPR